MTALLFSDLPALFEKLPPIANKLLLAFGGSAAAKFVMPHPLPQPSDGAKQWASNTKPRLRRS